ncbi:hypothetical protein HYH03_016416 [Edaphochlamys debaryana]|uniref:Uncharacterized protein n=1 Tax=Edaphochlamys debaryana TaxID=47281 RepID=A0A835XKC0_9CHLO|nr:hypothetical protein HYH03_016416 [Edaphochlamys debaryana]|eukprot:KAG2484762.1 hypothetical protein HYH03_016416 [Edaphochlamys debaryana]
MQTLLGAQLRLARPTLSRPGRSSLHVCASKGFGDAKTAPKAEPKGEAADAPSTSASIVSSADPESLEALEARIKSRRKKDVGKEAKVKVSAPAVDVATGKTAAPVESEAEALYLSFLSVYFFGVIGGGLALAAAGFLPEEADAFIMDQIYPSYSGFTVGFLIASSLYGLFKTGKLPGQSQRP